MTREELIDEMIGNFVNHLKDKDIQEVTAIWNEDSLGYDILTHKTNELSVPDKINTKH